MLSWVKEFRDFAMKGNVVDMAVGIIIGAAFGKIVTSIVNDLLMPVIGALGGIGSFGDQFLWLGEAAKPTSLELARKSGEPCIAWGPFLQTTIDFVIVAFAIFLLVKAMNQAQKMMALRKPEDSPAAPPPPPEDIQLLREIRDALTQR